MYMSSIKDLGPNHWRIVSGPGSELRVEPQSYSALSCAIVVIFIAFAVSVWFIPQLPLDAKTRICAISIIAGAVILVIFTQINRHQQRFGPYIVVNEKEILLRNNRRFELADFASFEVVRKWETTGFGQNQVSYLILKCKSNNEIEILGSIYHRGIVKLKTVLDGKMKPTLGKL